MVLIPLELSRDELERLYTETGQPKVRAAITAELDKLKELDRYTYADIEGREGGVEMWRVEPKREYVARLYRYNHRSGVRYQSFVPELNKSFNRGSLEELKLAIVEALDNAPPKQLTRLDDLL